MISDLFDGNKDPHRRTISSGCSQPYLLPFAAQDCARANELPLETLPMLD